jgi:copper chaperone CopZ
MLIASNVTCSYAVNTVIESLKNCESFSQQQGCHLISVLREIFNADINVVYQYIAYDIGIPYKVFQALFVIVSAS